MRVVNKYNFTSVSLTSNKLKKFVEFTTCGVNKRLSNTIIVYILKAYNKLQ